MLGGGEVSQVRSGVEVDAYGDGLGRGLLAVDGR